METPNISKTLRRYFLGKVKTFSMIVLTVLTIYLWSVCLGEYPGLHGDEAWSANKALDLKAYSLFSWNGMTYYTGCLQYLFSYISFGIFGEGILQLRVVGIIFNFCGLIVILSYLHKEYSKSTQISIFFLMLIGQSAFWMVYPRIAWEVNSFTLLFIAINLKYLRSFVTSGVTMNTTLIFFIVKYPAYQLHID